MTELFKIDKKLTTILQENAFTISAEVIPPRNGSPQAEILQQIGDLVKAGAQFLSVTKGAGGSLRGGSLPIAQVIKDHFARPAIAHFTCRDLTPEEVENQLMDHHYFGIRNILALRGDPPQGQPDWTPHPQSYPYAYRLMEQIVQLNQGQFLKRKDQRAQDKNSPLKTDFCIGAAAYPDEADPIKRTEYFKLKIAAGATYGITQMLYDVESYKKFLEHFPGTPVLPGFRILSSREQALRMKDRFQISMPEKILRALPSEKEKKNNDAAMETFFHLIDQFRRAGAPGIHVFVLSDIELACQALQMLLKNESRP